MTTTPNGAALPRVPAFIVTSDLLQRIAPSGKDLPALAAAMALHMPRYEMSTPRRVAMFLAQTAHESGGYVLRRENLSYSAARLCQVWPLRFPTIESAKPYERNPEALALKVYSNRNGNGGPETGDGWAFIGRGLIQITGRTNYAAMAEALQRPLDSLPAWLEAPEGAVLSALWFWKSRGLNHFADAGDFEELTRRINGGTVGLDDRRAWLAKVEAVLGIGGRR